MFTQLAAPLHTVIRADQRICGTLSKNCLNARTQQRHVLHSVQSYKIRGLQHFSFRIQQRLDLETLHITCATLSPSLSVFNDLRILRGRGNNNARSEVLTALLLESSLLVVIPCRWVKSGTVCVRSNMSVFT